MSIYVNLRIRRNLKDREFKVLDKFDSRIPLAEGFIRDGIVDWRRFGAQTPRLVFVLRDPHCDTPARWSLSELISIGNHSSEIGTWLSIAKWLSALRGETFSGNDPVKKAELFSCVSVVNLKKTYGGYPTDIVKLDSFVSEFKDLLHDQFAVYKDVPTVFVCCGRDGKDLKHSVFNLFKSVFDAEEWVSCDDNMILLWGHCIAIDFRHPANSKKRDSDRFVDLVTRAAEKLKAELPEGY